MKRRRGGNGASDLSKTERPGERELAVNGGPKAFAAVTGKGQPKIGVEEFMSVAERFGFTGEALGRIRAAVSNDDFVGGGPNLARYMCPFPEPTKSEQFEAAAREMFAVRYALSISS